MANAKDAILEGYTPNVEDEGQQSQQAAAGVTQTVAAQPGQTSVQPSGDTAAQPAVATPTATPETSAVQYDKAKDPIAVRAAQSQAQNQAQAQGELQKNLAPLSNVGETPGNPQTVSETTEETQWISEPPSPLLKISPEVRSLLPDALKDKDEFSYADLYLAINGEHKPMTEEERKAEEKKFKRKQLMDSIGRGLSAASNLFVTTKGSPSLYKADTTLADKERERYERMMKERADSDKSFMNGLLKSIELDNKAAQDRWSGMVNKHKLELQRKQEERAAKEAERKAVMDDWNAKKRELEVQYMAGKLTAQDLDNAYKTLRNQYAPLLEQSKIDKNNRSGRSGSGGGGGLKQIRSSVKSDTHPFGPVEEPDGIFYYSTPEYAKGAAQIAGTYDIIQTGETETTSNGIHGKTTTTSTTYRPVPRAPKTDEGGDNAGESAPKPQSKGRGY